MLKKIPFLFLIFISSLNPIPLHDIHISYGESVLSNQEFKGKITFYKDDFFKALKNWNNGNMKNFSNEEFDHLKLNYLQNNFIVEANGSEKLILILTEHSEDESLIWFGFRFESDAKINLLKITYKALFNEFSDQMNLLSVSTSYNEQSFVFKKSNPSAIIKNMKV